MISSYKRKKNKRRSIFNILWLKYFVLKYFPWDYLRTWGTKYIIPIFTWVTEKQSNYGNTCYCTQCWDWNVLPVMRLNFSLINNSTIYIKTAHASFQNKFNHLMTRTVLVIINKTQATTQRKTLDFQYDALHRLHINVTTYRHTAHNSPIPHKSFLFTQLHIIHFE